MTIRYTINVYSTEVKKNYFSFTNVTNYVYFYFSCHYVSLLKLPKRVAVLLILSDVNG